MTSLLLPMRTLGFDALEPLGEDIELHFEAIFRRTLALQVLVEVGCARLRFAERVLQKGDSLFG